MSMVTSCPACTTTFRVTPEQLTQRQGKVRCGNCSGVFDAFKSLGTLADEPPVEAPEPVAAPPASGSQHASFPQQGTLDIAPPSPLRDEPWQEAEPVDSQGRRFARALWIVAIVVLALLLAGQLAYALRDRLAAAWPASRPLLERLCAAADCTVAWPKRPDLLAIEASDLQVDSTRPNVLVLTATLRNRGHVGVARPALELTLTDVHEQTIARRIFLPADYLPGAANASREMPAQGEVEVRLELDTGELRPAGYRLFLFYP